MSRLHQAQAFAELAGVTVRALHHYDRLGLLTPQRSAARYRLYGIRELERLEQIVALKFLGLSLRQIRKLLDEDPRKLPDALRAQRRALEEKRRRLDLAIGAIRDAERSLRPGRSTDAAVLRKVIEVIEMQQDPEFWKRYYSDEAWARMADKRDQWTPELQRKAEQAWAQLFRDVEAALGTDPAGARAQELAARWQALVESFTGGDAAVSAGVKAAWADRPSWPAATKARTAQFGNPAVWEFMNQAMQRKKS
jgi:DNA-binding transcriptional MerR regulator